MNYFIIGGIVALFLIIIFYFMMSSTDNIDGDKIIFYSGANYTGNSYPRPVESSTRLNFYSINDPINSIQIPKGYQVTLFSKQQQQGDTIAFSENVPDLAKYAWDNKTAAYDYQKTDANAGASDTVFYTGNFSGAAFKRSGVINGYNMSVYSLPQNINSVTVPNGYAVTFYTGENYTGSAYTYKAGSSSLSSISGTIRSYKIYAE